MIVFCEFEQQFELIQKAKEYGLSNYINLVFRKNFSAQVLKANMKVVGNCEYGVLLYRENFQSLTMAVVWSLIVLIILEIQIHREFIRHKISAVA